MSSSGGPSTAVTDNLGDSDPPRARRIRAPLAAVLVTFGIIGAAVFAARFAGDDTNPVVATDRPTGGQPGSELVGPSARDSTAPPTTTTTVAPTTTTTMYARRYVGLRYRFVTPGQEEFPPGVQHFGGHLIIDKGGLEATRDPLFAIDRVQQGRHEFLWFERILTPRGEEPPFAEVVDALDIPARGVGDELLYDCAVNGAFDPELVAVARLGRERTTSDIRLAWRFSRQSKLIESVSSSGIACDNPGYGV